MDNLTWGLQMTVLGMGLVFALLALLWGLLTIVLRLDKPPAEVAAVVAPASEPATPAVTVAAGPASVQGMDAELVAAIVVATLTHRALRRREAAPAMRSYWPGSLLYASRWVGAGRSRQNHSWQRRGK
jgi:Na+-transporting methylmalonyl-CoA/oxaloacetate decarboxylase gamma subunit